MVWGGMFVGSAIGGYIPILFGSDWLSLWPIVGNAVGGLLGIYVGYKLGEYWGL